MKLSKGFYQLLLVFAFAGFSVQSLAQNADLKQAINHYKSNNLGLAEKEIEFAAVATHTSTEELARTMFYFFMIKSDLYGTPASIVANIEEFNKMNSALSSCLKNDVKMEFSSRIRERAIEVSDLLIEQAHLFYEDRIFLKYFYYVDHFADMKEAMGDNCGVYYQTLANAAGRAGYKPLQVKYWKKMIESKYEVEEAYSELLHSYYAMKMYDKVDAILEEAQGAFPQSTAFVRIEILRMMDRGLKFSALKKSQQITAEDQKNTEVFFLQGLLNMQMNHQNEALECFNRTLELEPDHFEATLELGRYYYRYGSNKNNLSQARTYLERAYQLKPKDPVTKELLHDVYVELGEIKLAVVLSD